MVSEEDIEYMEGLINLAKILLPTSEKATIQEKEIDVLENLLQGYKELKEENIIERIAKEEVEELLENSIPKSLVEEKIEKLKKEYDEFLECDREDDCQITGEIISILEELLKGDK